MSTENPYRLRRVCNEIVKRIEQKIDLLDNNVNDKLDNFKEDLVKAVEATVKKNHSSMSGKSKAAVISSAFVFASSIIVALIQALG